MERKSYTRLTLGLDIIGKITSGPFKGYHELSTVKHQIDLADTLTILPSSHLSLECDHPLVPCDERNVCLQAATLLQSEYRIDRSVHITIRKNIPVMGGLAGGSANAATTFMMLNELWKLHLSTEELMRLARKLGMDIPFYFIGKTAFDTEAGGICRPLPTKIAFSFVLALPDFGVSTADAYTGLDYSQLGKNLYLTEKMQQKCLANDTAGVVSCIHNDFEIPVFLKYPRLRELRDELLAAGCGSAILSGSGSTLLGIAPDYDTARQISRKISCRTIVATTLQDNLAEGVHV
jgi:4-diphosphocytidyl-2-C-methyl-D-erythritol kinase